MMATYLRCIADFWGVVHVPTGFVLPEFGIACGRHTLAPLIRAASRFAFASHHLRSDDDAAAHVLGRTNPLMPRTASPKPAAPKSP